MEDRFKDWLRQQFGGEEDFFAGDMFSAYNRGKREAAREIILHLQQLRNDEKGTLVGKEGTKGFIINWIFKTFNPDMS